MKRRQGPTRTTGWGSWFSHPSEQKFVPPRTAEEFFAMTEHRQDTWTRVTHVITRMRADDVSLTQAAQEFALAPDTVLKLAGSALQELPNGRYAAEPSDQLLRVEVVPTPEGLREIGVPDSEQASLLGKYWNAVHRYLETGDNSPLREFEGKHITDAGGQQVPLLTDIEELAHLASAGVLSFESLYVRAG